MTDTIGYSLVILAFLLYLTLRKRQLHQKRSWNFVIMICITSIFWFYFLFGSMKFGKDGVFIIAIGGTLNCLVVLINHGAMPHRHKPLQTINITIPELLRIPMGKEYITLKLSDREYYEPIHDKTKLVWLGSIMPTGLGYVSIGDVVQTSGVIIFAIEFLNYLKQ